MTREKRAEGINIGPLAKTESSIGEHLEDHIKEVN